MDEVYLGSHIPMKGPEFYLGSVKTALSYGENAFMIYTGAPQNSFRLPTDKLMIPEGRALLKEHGIDESKIIVHAPYIINLANDTRPDSWDFAKKTLINELRRVHDFHLGILVLHPGNHVGIGKEKGLDCVVRGLDEVLAEDGTDVRIAVETMAGKGTEVGATLDELKYILEHVKDKDRVGICLDTCHMSDSGIDVRDVDAVLENFDKKIGLSKLLCVHLNDSKNTMGAHKDRHENVGYGTIGFDILYKYVHDPRLKGIPMCLETPFYNGIAPYKQEVEMLRTGNYVPGWREALTA